METSRERDFPEPSKDGQFQTDQEVLRSVTGFNRKGREWEEPEEAGGQESTPKNPVLGEEEVGRRGYDWDVYVRGHPVSR